MSENGVFTKWIDGDNTVKINYVILFFIFVIGLSNNVFRNMFGTRVKSYFKSGYIKHFVCVFFLFLLLDVNTTNAKDILNPFFNLVLSFIIYTLVLLLTHSNQLYIAFITIILFILIVLHKFKTYYENTINDQEILQGILDLIYKTNNVFVIIIILIIIIGSLTSLDRKALKKSLANNDDMKIK